MSSAKSRTAAVILAAGQGKRMKSSLPKVLHTVGGMPMVAHVVQLALAQRCSPVVVVVDAKGRRVRDLLTAQFPDAPLRFAVQTEQRGTGDATRVGLGEVRGAARILVLYGDVPLLTQDTLVRLQRAAAKAPLAFLSAVVPDPTGYGRVVRQDGRAVSVVEHKDCSAAERAIAEINAGVYLSDAALLRRVVSRLRSDNAQHELYLTDVVAAAARAGGAVAVQSEDLAEIQGVNDRRQLAEAESQFRRRRIHALMEAGVTFHDPASTVLDAQVEVGRDAVIGIAVQLRGRSRIGAGAIIEGPTVIVDSNVEPGAHVHAFSHLQGAQVGAATSVGPFARLRPGADLGPGAKVGNFVEVKNARLGPRAKANHLAYIGDADIGEGSNIGAGTITCNYDGVRKHRTELGAGVFVGSNSTLVAPLSIGAGAYIAAGSTLTRDVPAEALAFGRARQEHRPGYARLIRERQKAAPAAAAPAPEPRGTKPARTSRKGGGRPRSRKQAARRPRV